MLQVTKSMRSSFYILGRIQIFALLRSFLISVNNWLVKVHPLTILFSSYFSDVVEMSTALLLIEDFMDVNPVWQARSVLSILKSNTSSLSANISSSKGHGLGLLRICNELVRRTPKTTDSVFCGELLLLLSRIFPSDERSGVNLRGDYNVENITSIDPAPSHTELTVYSLESVISAIENRENCLLPFSIYSDFWKLQSFFLHPYQAISSDNLKFVTKMTSFICALFDQVKSISNTHSGEDEFPCPKFASSRRLLGIQLNDTSFRQTIVVQLLVFLTNITEIMVKAGDDTKMQSEYIAVVQELTKKLYWILNQSCLHKLVGWIQKGERNWVEWKQASCPPLVNISQEEETTSSFHVNSIQTLEENEVGSKELTRLWSNQKLNQSSRPSLEFLLKPLVEQLDPSEKIELEYRLSADPIYLWKVVRLLTYSSSSEYSIGAIKTQSDLDNFVAARYNIQ